MMRPFRDQPIARKALVLGIVPTVTAILLVIGLSMLATYIQASSNLERDVEAEAALVADNVGAALVFNDRSAATETVRGYHSKTNIDAVCVFDAHGALFAAFSRRPDGCSPDRRREPRSTIVREQTVLTGNRPVGTVRVTGNFSRLSSWTRRQAAVGLGTFVVGALFSLVLTRRLGRSITEPLEHLAATAERVSAGADYTARATKMSDDEVGRLVGSFNQMLDQIQAQHDASAALLEREKQASRLKDHFLAAVSHELRTPLNAILGWLQIIQTTRPTPATLQRALESLDRNSRAQARVVDDLIEVSRVVTGKLQLRVEVVDLRSVLRAALDVVDAALKAKGVQLSYSPPDEAHFVSGDPDRLQQVLWNLLSNAVKFTPPGGLVTVRLSRAAGDCTVTVSDTGIGIPSEFIPYVFDRFRQADGSLTREHGGLGLGLAIAKELAELHGGSVAATSPGKGRGATLTLAVPAIAAGAAGVVAARLPMSPFRADALTGLRVLSVDDDADALEVVSEGLRSAGAEVRAAQSGAEAVSLWQRGRFDVLVCDLAMPQMDGYEVLAQIRALSAAGDSVTAIALSAHTSEADRQSALAAGFGRHLSKPLDLSQLIGAIAEEDRGQPPLSIT